MRTPALVKPPITTIIQKILTSRLVVEMYESPCIVEDSKNALTPSMVVALRLSLTVVYLEEASKEIIEINLRFLGSSSQTFKSLTL